MLFYVLFRVVSAAAAFLYPGYASYKVLSQRPASEEDLERWLMYWSVLGCIVAAEHVAEWLVSWLPFYYPLKTLLLLALALPQAHGAAYVFRAHLRPFLAAHERAIDAALAQLRARAGAALQRLLRAAWEHGARTLRQMDAAAAAPADADAAGVGVGVGVGTGVGVGVGAQPTLGDPVSGPAQLVAGLWGAYAPSVLASGAALLRQAQASASAAADAPPYDVAEPGVPMPASSSAGAALRQRTDSSTGRSTFEEVEVPSDMEGEGEGGGEQRPAQQRRASWFGWGASGGYERVKSA